MQSVDPLEQRRIRKLEKKREYRRKLTARRRLEAEAEAKKKEAELVRRKLAKLERDRAYRRKSKENRKLAEELLKLRHREFDIGEEISEPYKERKMQDGEEEVKEVCTEKNDSVDLTTHSWSTGAIGAGPSDVTFNHDGLITYEYTSSTFHSCTPSGLSVLPTANNESNELVKSDNISLLSSGENLEELQLEKNSFPSH